jgi:hemerythrin-like domain-containing protein
MKSTDTLTEEHRQILRMLDVLAKMVDRTKEGLDISDEDAADLLRFFRMYSDQRHHAKEETILFPALEKAGMPTNGGPVGCMLEEHDQGRAYVAGIDDAIGSGNTKAFVEKADRFDALLRDHIRKEDEVLYPMACDLLTEDDDDRMLDEFGEADRQFGKESLEQIVSLVRRLEAEYLAQAGSPSGGPH